MHFKKTVARAGLLLGVAAVLGSSPAMAYDINSYKDGAVHAYSYGTNTRVAVTDTKEDGNTVYAEYGRSAESGRYTLHNKSGEGATATSGSGSKVWYLRGCISLSWEPDRCDVDRT
ncbi:hypothetical protein ACFZBM_39005 [Streptomyces lavendulae]|uniref:hypothetical protein n=1 Tax=Streptomyces lavendulae TaxID=1914 RepID=UPI0036E75C6D